MNKNIHFGQIFTPTIKFTHTDQIPKQRIKLKDAMRDVSLPSVHVSYKDLDKLQKDNRMLTHNRSQENVKAKPQNRKEKQAPILMKGKKGLVCSQ